MVAKTRKTGRRRRPVNPVQAIRENRARLRERGRASLGRVHQARPIEPRHHETTPIVYRDGIEYLGRRHAGGADRSRDPGLVDAGADGIPGLKSFTTRPGAQAWTSAVAPPPILSPSEPDIDHHPLCRRAPEDMRFAQTELSRAEFRTERRRATLFRRRDLSGFDHGTENEPRHWCSTGDDKCSDTDRGPPTPTPKSPPITPRLCP